MKTNSDWAPGPDLRILGAERQGAGWVVTAEAPGPGCCPGCDRPSRCRHGWRVRHLQDLPVQGAAVTLNLKVGRWRCRDLRCNRRTFTAHLPLIAEPFARRTRRVSDLARLLTHAAGGRPAERLVTRLGLPQSDDTLLRSLKRHAARRQETASVRVVGIDDWSWRKGTTYGTILVDLERREVLDVLADRSAHVTSQWLTGHSEIEIVNRDRAGLYADGARQGAPQALQVADRFHLLQNLRKSIEQQMSRAPRQHEPFVPDGGEPLLAAGAFNRRYEQPEVMEHRLLLAAGRRAADEDRFARLKTLQAGGESRAAIVREIGLNWRTVAKWIRLDTLPERRAMAPKTTTPEHFRAYLTRRWAEGSTMGRDLLAELIPLGYTGSLTNLQRFLNPWRRAQFLAVAGLPAPHLAAPRNESPAHPAVPPIAAAALCIKPRGQLTEEQAAKVDMLKATSTEFASMRGLAMRFRGILKGADPGKLDPWLDDALSSRIHCMRQFAIKLRQDAAAVRNAITEVWSNGQVEGQINRLKTLKRAMYGRAGIALLRARMLSLKQLSEHTV
jgi:transposase